VKKISRRLKKETDRSAFICAAIKTATLRLIQVSRHCSHGHQENNP
jgi:hypothetical protein